MSSIHTIAATSGERTRTAIKPTAVTGRSRKLHVLALVFVVLIGLVHLFKPFHDDQTFFTIGAWKMSHGAVLYRDYWDIKQPGIFLFYLAGGKLFGFDEVGIHGFELLYMTGLALVLMVTLRNYFEGRWASALVALFTAGFYYGVTGLPHVTLDYLTQVEGLVGFPMFLCLWFATRAGERKGSNQLNLFLSGIMGAVVLLFKLMFLPMVLCFWGAAFWFYRKGQRTHLAIDAIKFVAPFGAGLLLPILLVCAYFVGHAALTFLWYSSFVWPVRAIGKLPLAGRGRLYEGLQFFVDGFAPLLALGLIGALSSLHKRADLLTIQLLLWLAVGMGVILVQLRSWWPHHFLLFCVPLGVLATKGFEFLAKQLPRSEFGTSVPGWRVPFAFAIVLLFSPVIYPVLGNALLLASYRFALTKEHRLGYQCHYPGSQYLASSDLSFLSDPQSLPGAIYVGGSSLYYYQSGRLPAIALCAGVDDFLPEQWQAFARELADARPTYIFLSPVDQRMVEAKTPEALHFIEDSYRVLRSNATGTWYRRNVPGPLMRDNDGPRFGVPSPGCPARESTTP